MCLCACVRACIRVFVRVRACMSHGVSLEQDKLPCHGEGHVRGLASGVMLRGPQWAGCAAALLTFLCTIGHAVVHQSTHVLVMPHPSPSEAYPWPVPAPRPHRLNPQPCHSPHSCSDKVQTRKILNSCWPSALTLTGPQHLPPHPEIACSTSTSAPPPSQGQSFSIAECNAERGQSGAEGLQRLPPHPPNQDHTHRHPLPRAVDGYHAVGCLPTAVDCCPPGALCGALVGKMKRKEWKKD